MKLRTLQEIEALLSAPSIPATRILHEIWDQRQFSTEPKSARPAESLPAVLDWLKQDVRMAVSLEVFSV